MRGRMKKGLISRAVLLLAGVATAGVLWAQTAPTRDGQTPAPVAALEALALEAGTGSAQPHLSATPSGTVVLSWLEPGDGDGRTRLRVAELAKDGRTWGNVRTVAEGTHWFVNWADVPSVVPITDTTWAAHWLERSDPDTRYAYDVRVVVSRDGGRTWSAPVTPHDDGTRTEHGFVSFFRWPNTADDVGLAWLDGRATKSPEATGAHAGHGAGNMALRVARLTSDGAVHDGRIVDDRVCECCPTTALTLDDGVLLGYRNRGDDETRDTHVVRYRGDWQRDHVAVRDGWQIAACPVNGPALTRVTDGVALAWFTAEGDDPRVQVAFSRDGGTTWSSATRVDGGRTLGRIGLAAHPQGGGVVSWIAAETNGATVRLRRVAPDGTTGAPIVAAHVASSRLSGYPRIVAAGDALVVAWVAEDEGDGGREGRRTRVRTARLPFSAVP